MKALSISFYTFHLDSSQYNYVGSRFYHTSGFQPKISTSKIFPFQTRRLSIGGMRKRTKSDAECEEYVCPMDTEIPVPLQKIFSPRLRKTEGVQQGVVTNQKTRGDEQQVSEAIKVKPACRHSTRKGEKLKALFHSSQE